MTTVNAKQADVLFSGHNRADSHKSDHSTFHAADLSHNKAPV